MSKSKLVRLSENKPIAESKHLQHFGNTRSWLGILKGVAESNLSLGLMVMKPRGVLEEPQLRLCHRCNVEHCEKSC